LNAPKPNYELAADWTAEKVRRVEYDIEKNSELAKNLKGHLMLSTGEIDNNVHPANTCGWPMR
jgi:hypothetical protein